MQTKRLFLRERTIEIRKKLLSLPLEEQLTFIGVDENRLKLELSRIEKGLTSWKQDYKMWDLILLETNEVVGDCGFHSWYINHQRAELGYGLKEEYRGLGIMSEALKAVLDFGFNEMDLNRIEAFISPTNTPSRKLVERYGFTLEGLHRQHYKVGDLIDDSVSYGLLKKDYFDKLL